MRVAQEFYCATSGGGCGGYIVFPLNIAINGVVEVMCPKCSHKHQRAIKDGILTENGRWSEKVVQEITPTLAAWSQTTRYLESTHRAGSCREREAVVIDENVIKDDSIARAFLNDRWFEIHGDK